MYLPVPFTTSTTPYLSIPTPLPNLTYLFLSGAFILSSPDKPSRVPNIERLHITRAMTLPLDVFASQITRLAPNLKNLKISCPLNRLAESDFLLALRAPHLAKSKNSQTITAPSAPAPTHPFPSTLQQISIHPFTTFTSSDIPVVAADDPVGVHRSAIASLDRTEGMPDYLADRRSRDNRLSISLF